MTTEVPAETALESKPFQDGNALASLAILSVNVTERHLSYLDHFISFVVEALSTACGGQGGTMEVTNALKTEFGLQIPQAVVRNILRRASKLGEIDRTRDQDFYSIRAETAKDRASFRTLRANALRQQASLAQGLATFSLERFNIGWTLEEAESALQDFVAKISTSRIRQVLGTLGDSQRGEDGAEEVTQALVIGEFVTSIVESDPVAFNSLESLVKGSMLAATLYLPGSTELTNKFRDTTIWIDAPVALQWLGFEGEEALNYVDSLMELAHQQGARLGMFSHCVRELRAIVSNATDGLDNYSSGYHASRVTIKFRKDGVTKPEGRIRVQTLETDLIRRRVVIEDSPEIDPRYSIDENRLEAVFREKILYQWPSAMFSDLKSLVAVHQLRRGEYSDLVENSRAIFVTANTKVAGIAKSFFERPSGNWPEAILDHELAALLWSKSPMNAPDLPRNQIIADALAALRPSQDLWDRYGKMLEKLVARNVDLTDAVLVLRNDSEAQRILMEYSGGDPNNVTPEIVQVVLKEIAESSVAPVRAELASRTEELAVTASELAEVTKDFVLVNEEKDNYQRRLEKLELVLANRRGEAIAVSKTWEKRVTITIKTVTVALLVAAGLVAVQIAFGQLTPSVNLQGFIPSWLKWVLGLGGLVAVIVDLALKPNGHTFFGIAKCCGDWTQRFIQKRRFRAIGIDDETANRVAIGDLSVAG